MNEVSNPANLAPGKIDSIDKLVEIGKERFFSTSTVGHVVEPAIPGADLYFKSALELMRQRGIQNPQMEFNIELRLGSYLGFMKKYDEAVPHFERCVELEPQNIRARRALAWAYRDVGRSAESAGEYRKVAELSSPISLSRYLNFARAAIVKYNGISDRRAA